MQVRLRQLYCFTWVVVVKGSDEAKNRFGCGSVGCYREYKTEVECKTEVEYEHNLG